MERTRLGKSGNPDRLRTAPGAVLLLAGLCVVAYLPCFNNGFISDDYVILDRLDPLSQNFFYLFRVPPECFRLTSYVFFGILRFLFGCQAPWYYAFSVTLHFVNSVLLWKLLGRITLSYRIGFLAAVFFASIQGHQEAVMWLAAMNEVLLGLCLLASLLLWERGWFGWASACYLAGLFSKESAMVLLGLAPLLEWRPGSSPRFHRGHVFMLAISAAFAALFYRFAASNFMLDTGTYSLSFHAALVFFLSMHRLMFPWIYLAVILCLMQKGGWRAVKSSARGLVFAAYSLLPYIFLTYQAHVTSRQEYVASIGMVWASAILATALDRPVLRRAFIVAFVAANIGYIWIKDRQFELRAAPTTRLIEAMKARSPQKMVLLDFPANPWIARITAKMAPGWHPEMIHVDPPASECPSCLTLRWDPKQNLYREARRR